LEAIADRVIEVGWNVFQPALLRLTLGGSVVRTRPCSTAPKVC